MFGLDDCQLLRFFVDDDICLLAESRDFIALNFFQVVPLVTKDSALVTYESFVLNAIDLRLTAWVLIARNVDES